MSEETNRDDPREAELVVRLLDDLARGDAPELDLEAPDASARREYLELLGLLGASVEPIAPPREIRRQLLAEVGPIDGAASAAAVVDISRPAPRSAPAASPRRWALPLAASLAVALAAVSGYQATQLADQRATIAELSRRLEGMESRVATVASVRGQLAAMQERMELITGRGVEICALRPMATEPQLAASRGVLYVAADHQHWYLTIEGLTPCSEGRSYQLWFVPEDGEPVSAGTFDVGDGVRVELSSSTMPAATRAVTVTLEPAGGSQAPTGPAILHGDEVMAVL